MSQLSERSIRDSILGFLAPKLTESGSVAIDDDANLMGAVLIDSPELLELVIWVEENVQIEFNPDGLNLEDGLTIRQLISAFEPAKASANGSSHS
jgi:hypothetical protein